MAATRDWKDVKTHQVNDRIFCFHSGKFYEAKIVEVAYDEGGQPVYTVHYQGWHKRYDETLTHRDAEDRFQEFSDEKLKKMKEEERESKRKIEVVKRPALTSSTNSVASTPSTATAAERKKAIKKPVRLLLPQSLAKLLVDDCESVQTQHRLHRLPAKFTVRDICREYCESFGRGLSDLDEFVIEFPDAESGDGNAPPTIRSTYATIVESTHGIIDFMDTLLSRQLLYKFEREQYAQLVAKAEEEQEEAKPSKRRKKDEPEASAAATATVFKPSETYGLAHLCRLLVNFESIMPHTLWDEATIGQVFAQLQDFATFLDANRDKYWCLNESYEQSTPEYQRKVFTS